MSGTAPISRDAIEAILLERLLRLRRRSPGPLDATTPFNEFGIDSLESAGIAVELETEFGIAVDAVAFLDHPTPRALAGHLADRLAQEARP